MSKFNLCVTSMLLIAGAFTAAAPSSAQSVCGDRTKFIETLAKKFDESPSAFGIASQRNLVELFVSKSGSWTMIMTSPNGTACIVATGQSWEQFPATAKMTAL